VSLKLAIQANLRSPLLHWHQ